MKSNDKARLSLRCSSGLRSPFSESFFNKVGTLGCISMEQLVALVWNDLLY